MQTIRIVVAVRDEANRIRLVQGLGSRPEFAILQEATDLMQTFSAIEDGSPNVVLIDDTLIVKPEFEVMRALFQSLDIRWLQVSTGASAGLGSQAGKGSDLFPVNASMPMDRIARNILELSRAPVRMKETLPPATVSVPLSRDDRVVLIGASTGGVDALITVLKQYPSDGPATVIVQHTGQGFGTSLVKLLDQHCACSVTAAQDGSRLQRGQVLVAAGCNGHLQIEAGAVPRTRLAVGPARSGHMPSIDVMFESAAPLANRCTAALLTGMGRDGAQGLLTLRMAGAMTIAQDAATSVVYGMPRVASELGAALKILPLQDIGRAILSSVRITGPIAKGMH